MKEYIAVGSPIGKLNKEEKYYFTVGEQILGMEETAYKIWLCFVGGNTVENVIKNPKLLKKTEETCIRVTVKEMILTGILITADEIDEFVLIRNGIGAGYNEKRGGYCVISEQIHKLSRDEYFIWCSSDGRKKVKEIQREFQDMGKEMSTEQIRENVISLTHKAVVFLIMED